MPRLQKQSRAGPVVLAFALVLVFGTIVAFALGLLRAVAPPDFGPLQSTVWSLVSFSAALGAVAMVLVQLIRQLVPFRGEFHKEQLVRLLKSAPEGTMDKALMALAGGHASDEAFDMPLEQLCGQLAAAADRVIADPKSALAEALAGSDGKSALETLRTQPTQAANPSEPSKEDLARLTAQQNLARIIQGRIDRFQIETGAAWRRRLRSTVLQVSLFFGLVIAFAGARRSGSVTEGLGFVVYGALSGVMGAFFAMLFRDLTALAERRRL